VVNWFRSTGTPVKSVGKLYFASWYRPVRLSVVREPARARSLPLATVLR
jgi:hypothetical protein